MKFERNPVHILMTKLVYVEDAYVRTFEANIVRADRNLVALDITAFYPQGGGQVGDTGEIDTFRVIDTRKVEGEVVHFLEKDSPFHVGQKVRGSLNWERRYKIMRLHSASHIVQYIIQEELGTNFKPTSPGLVDDLKDRTDYSFNEKLELEKLNMIEARANEIIRSGYEIQHYSDKDDPELRYWKIDLFPAMPCGGTHPKNTKEIGKIRLRRGKKPGAGRERVEITLVSN